MSNGDVYKKTGGAYSVVASLAGPSGPAGPGDVVGPSSATDNAVARFDATTGKLIQNGNTLVVGDISATALNVNSAAAGSGLQLQVVSSGTNESLYLTPKGTGVVRIEGTNPTIYSNTGQLLLNDGNQAVTITSGVFRFGQRNLQGVTLIGVGLGASTVPTYAVHVAPTASVTAGQTGFFQDATATTGRTRVVFKAGAVTTGNILDILDASDVSKFGITAAGSIVAQAGYHEMVEMTAPGTGGADKVRIYAEDNGSGKTRLMAIFPTGAAVQLAIEP